MKVKDYLHLYLGAEVVIIPWSRAFNPKLKMAPMYKIGMLKMIDISGTSTIKHALSDNPFTPEQLKLILRPLSDMTDNEALEIAEIIALPQYIDVKILLNRSFDTVDEKYKIQRIDYQAYQQLKHSG